jgi:hypothetical protein
VVFGGTPDLGGQVEQLVEAELVFPEFVIFFDGPAPPGHRDQHA